MSRRTTSLLTAAVLAFALGACDSAGFASTPAGPPAEPPVSEPWHAMLNAVNAARAEGAQCGDEYHVPAEPVAWNSRLELAALTHTVDMLENDHFAHVGTDGSEPGDRARRVGYQWRVVGENIARYQPTVAQVVEDWLASPSHCRQIMDPAYVEMGAAEEDRYWTQVFGVRH